MSVLNPSNLETVDIGTSGWNAIYSANFQKINAKLGHLMSALKVAGTATLTLDAKTNEDITDNSTGTPTLTIGAISGSGADTDINNNFASITAAINKLNVDVNNLHDTLTDLLAELRKTTGNGVLGG